MRNPNYVPELSFIFKEVRTSILVFFQLYWDTRTLTIVERLLSIPILGTLILALRRKLERRVRH
jgi:ABC-type multidrug transport system fused ATPase/permease subunit